LSREADFGQFFHPTFSILELCMRLGPDHGQPQQGLEFGEYLDGLYGYALVLSRNTAEAQDLVQETCLRALRAMGELRADESLQSWLFTILRKSRLARARARLRELLSGDHMTPRAEQVSRTNGIRGRIVR
jgi:hypothetical protein